MERQRRTAKPSSFSLSGKCKILSLPISVHPLLYHDLVKITAFTYYLNTNCIFKVAGYRAAISYNRGSARTRKYCYRDGPGLGSMALHLAHHCFSFNMRWI